MTTMPDGELSAMSSWLPLSSTLNALLKERARRNPTDPHAWAMANRTIAGHHMIDIPALAAIARDMHPMVVVQKSAQVGMTELGVNLALWAADTGHADRGNALYLMPT